MNSTMKEKNETVMSFKTKELKNCTKSMAAELHTQTVYDCANVTKQHCTTLWTTNSEGERLWAGTDDDCREVTWEECKPVEKEVPMVVAQMECVPVPVRYADYENTTTEAIADTIDCSVHKKPVCEPMTSKKCAETTYTRCEEVPDTVCSLVEIPVPSQEKLHKQWCLFDQVEGELDFAKEVSKISGSVDLQLEKAAETPEKEYVEDLEGSADPEIQEEADEKGSKVSDVRNSLNEDGTLLANALDLRKSRARPFDRRGFLSQLTLLDVQQSPRKRQIGPTFQPQNYARGIRPGDKVSMKVTRRVQS